MKELNREGKEYVRQMVLHIMSDLDLRTCATYMPGWWDDGYEIADNICEVLKGFGYTVIPEYRGKYANMKRHKKYFRIAVSK